MRARAKWIVGIDVRRRSDGAVAFAAWLHEKLGDALVGVHVASPGTFAAMDQTVGLVHSDVRLRMEIEGSLVDAGIGDAYARVEVIEAQDPVGPLEERCSEEGAFGMIIGRAARQSSYETVRLAEGLGRKIMFVRVVNPLIERSSLYPARETVEKEQTDQQREAEAQARGWLMDLEVEGPLDVRRGGTLEEILGAVRRHHAAFVVCGTRRLGLLGRIFSGSLSSELAAYSSVPVLVVPPDAT